jgi:hypothetical protein
LLTLGISGFSFVSHASAVRPGRCRIAVPPFATMRIVPSIDAKRMRIEGHERPSIPSRSVSVLKAFRVVLSALGSALSGFGIEGRGCPAIPIAQMRTAHAPAIEASAFGIGGHRYPSISNALMRVANALGIEGHGRPTIADIVA